MHERGPITKLEEYWKGFIEATTGGFEMMGKDIEKEIVGFWDAFYKGLIGTAEVHIKDVRNDFNDAKENLINAFSNGSSSSKKHEETKGTGNNSKNVSRMNFGSTEKLESHFGKHGGEFGGAYSNANEYLAGANNVIENGIKVQYEYKGELRTGYVKFMKNSGLTNAAGVPIKSYAKFEFVGTNNLGEITTYHVESGKTFWKMMNNGENIPVINPVE